LQLVSPQNPPVDILIVDDLDRNLTALGAVLERPDYNVVKATSGAEALEALRQRDFAVVLLDVMMPGMDGFECARQVRSCSRCNSVPIIFVSAVANEMNFVFQGYSAGAVDYIVKPLEPAVVRAKVAIFVELFRANQVLRQQLEESRALCRRLEAEKSASQRDYDSAVSQVRAFTTAFEERLRPIDLQRRPHAWIRR
jgi:PleD family two-component response regulator